MLDKNKITAILFILTTQAAPAFAYNSSEAWADASDAISKAAPIFQQIMDAIGIFVAVGLQVAIVLMICAVLGLLFRVWHYVFRG